MTAIYKSKGAAGEYAKYACNFYIGCSINCTYCYNKTGRFAKTLGGSTPTLKKSFKNETQALATFKKEALANLKEHQKHGIFFSFTTDPLLPETENLTYAATVICNNNNIPVSILTKKTQWLDSWLRRSNIHNPNQISIGVSITGDQNLEPGAATEQERINAIIKLKQAGFRTFISFEPIKNWSNIHNAITTTKNHCHRYMFGYDSTEKKIITLQDKSAFDQLTAVASHHNIYLKNSFLKAHKLTPEQIPKQFHTSTQRTTK